MTKTDSAPESPNINKLIDLGLTGTLEAFEGTAAVPYIYEALTKDGTPYKPGYDIRKSEHMRYLGLPVDTIDERYNAIINPELSPIMTRLIEAIKSGEIILDKPDLDSLRFRIEQLPTRYG